MKRNFLICIALALTSIPILADYADSVWLDYQEGLTTSGDVIMTDIRVEETALYTYYAGLVWNHGYMGLQRGGGPYFKHVHFSLWDPPHGGFAEVVWAADGVVTERFGGEGTGWKSMWPFDWQDDITYRLCVALVHTNSATDYMAFFFDPAAGEWKHLATFRRSDALHSFSYVASFVEDFGSTLNNRRSCLLGNAWLRTFDLDWIDLRTARYATGGSKTNKDADLVGDMFRLETGGDIVNDTPSGTVFTRAPGTTDPVTAGPVPVLFDHVIEDGAICITKYTGPGGEVVIPQAIDGVPVTAVGDYAFYHLPSLTSITIPGSVATIGSWAFAYCRGLTTLAVPNGTSVIGRNAFRECTGLANVTISDSVVRIGSMAFYGCRSLTEIKVEVPNHVYSSLDGVLFSHDRTELIQYPMAKGGSYAIPESVTSIWSLAFHGCTGLTSVAIPDSVTSIGYLAFATSSSLTKATIGNGVATVGGSMFGSCPNLTSVTIGNGVTSIEDHAFRSCHSLVSVKIPNNVTRIIGGAFFNCSSLTTITIPSRVNLIGCAAFSWCDKLTAIYFEGDAPELQPEWVDSGDSPWEFDYLANPATIYYLPGTLGWGPTFGGRPTMPWGVVWGSPVRGDVNGDGVVDRNDLNLIVATKNRHAVDSEDPRDLDGDGMITVLDARILVTLFSLPGGFTRVESSAEGLLLEWKDGGGALKLQSTSDLVSGTWQDVEGLQSSTNAVRDAGLERQFFRLVPVE